MCAASKVTSGMCGGGQTPLLQVVSYGELQTALDMSELRELEDLVPLG